MNGNYFINVDESEPQIINMNDVHYIKLPEEKNSKSNRKKSFSSPKINIINNKNLLSIDNKFTEHVRNGECFEKVWEDGLNSLSIKNDS